MAYGYTQFRDTVVSDYDRRRGNVLMQKSMRHDALLSETKALGHPLFEPLEVGERRSAPIAAVFLDLTNFTGRTFWDDPTEVADLAHAIMTGFIEVVSEFGGFPLGLRGDGLFAGFGPGYAPTDVTLALGACAFALNAVQDEVNPWLSARGIEPVQARAGVDYGEITFIRSGSRDHNEVNPIGFAANFAAKCEKKAKSWEVVAGEGAAAQAGSADLFVPHADSPKSYTRNYETKYYKFFDYRWRRTLSALPGVLRDLGGQPATSIKTA
jgi:class 3 adenylate cyclase